jgi:uncharacterized protein YqeY
MSDLRPRLREALPSALKGRDRVATAAPRFTLAAIENAEAVDAASSGRGVGIEESPVGVRATEARRRDLTEA